jgi:hypothetical protein
MSPRLLWIVCAVLVVIAAGSTARRIAEGGTTPAVQPVDESFVWDVSVDSDGRPYDTALLPGTTLTRRPLTVLHAPSRRVLFMGGEYLPTAELDEPSALLAERPGRRYPLHAIWARYDTGVRSIVGVVVVERDTPIVRWRILHGAAYVTDGGTGGITTYEWAAQDTVWNDEVGRLYDSEFQKGRDYFTADADGHPGVDTIAFNNGFGDGVFPAIAGYDAAGDRVEIVLWTKVEPWRLAFPDGKPPPEVTKVENDFAACLKGRRKVQGSPCRLAPK